MRYRWFGSRGLFTGSGVVEAGCKSIVASASNKQECTRPPTAQTPSSPCAAQRPAASGKPPATPRTLRHEPPDQPGPKMILVTCKIDAHPVMTSAQPLRSSV
jgi:hypothetical protein